MTVSETSRVDFYIFESANPNALINMACKIVEKAYNHQQMVAILTPNKDISAIIDKALWTFNDVSFIPHVVQPTQDHSNDTPPVMISHEINSLLALNHKNILLNLTHEIDLTSFGQFKRIIEMVNESSDAEEKTKARQKYKTYRDNPFMLHSHHVKP